MLDLSFDCANATRLLSGLKDLTNLEILSMHVDICNSTNIKELLLGIQEVHSLKKLELNLNLQANTDSIKEVTKALISLRWLLINLTIDAFFFSSGENGVIELAYGLGNLTELRELSLYLNWGWHGDNLNDESAIVLQHLHNLHTLKLHLICGMSCDKLYLLI